MGPAVGKLCGGRPFPPEFVAPNTDHVTLRFDYRAPAGSSCSAAKVFGSDATEAGEYLASSPVGVLLSSPGRIGRSPAKRFYTVKQCIGRAADVRVILSGRVFVHCLEGARFSPGRQAGREPAACVLRMCTRGCPVYESVRTQNYTHTANVVTSGIFFELFTEISGDTFYLNPRLAMVLECGGKLLLVEDRIGPLPMPATFYTDFAILDDCGRNLQMDLIFRLMSPQLGLSAKEGKLRGEDDAKDSDVSSSPGTRTVRTCLQDYTTFNNQAKGPSVVLSPAELEHMPQGAQAHLQSLVVSEDHRPRGSAVLPFTDEGGVPASIAGAPGSPNGSGRRAGEVNGHSGSASEAAAALCSGAARPCVGPPAADADAKASFAENIHGDHESTKGAPAEAAPQAVGGQLLYAGDRVDLKPANNLTQTTGGDESDGEFWHHVRYGVADHQECRRSRSAYGGYEDAPPPLKGEFWLTKDAVDKGHVYMQCTTTLAEAITMCIIFRFSCQIDFLSLIEHQAGGVLQDLHIPTNGFVMGVEMDPRHAGLYRMFVEHRNDILDDIVVCECAEQDLQTTTAHQEVYDSGDMLTYKLTLRFASGQTQQVCLQQSTERADLDERLHEEPEPSLRWPILPCAPRLISLLSPANRIFIYSSKLSRVCVDDASFATPTALVGSMQSIPGNVSDCTAEDWESVAGGASDGEADCLLPAACSSANMWKRPVVDSVVLVCGVAELPFSCGAANICTS